MTIAGVLVVCRPEHLGSLQTTLERFPWAKVHHSQPDGRFVITIESENTDGNMSRLREIQSLPHVILAELVEQYVDEEPEA